MSPALSWTPYSFGDYTLTIEIMSNMENRDLLSTPLTLQVNIPGSPESCPSGTVLVNGVCEPEQPICGAGTIFVNGVCEVQQGVIQNAPGSSTPGCEETNSCFIPSTITINVGEEVQWENNDSVAHTMTSGDPSDGPNGIFDSGLTWPGGGQSHTFYTVGTYPYFCVVHPWMTGIVIVQGESEPEPEPEPEPVETESEVIAESDEIIPGSEIQIQTDIVNQQVGSQLFAYIVQIKDETGTPISISTITGSLAQGQTLTQAISWTPNEPGVYITEIFLWDDLQNPDPLSSVEIQYFTVTG